MSGFCKCSVHLGLGSGAAFPASNLQVHNTFYTGAACLQSPVVPLKLGVSGEATSATFTASQSPSTYYFAPVPLSTATTSIVSQPIKFQTVTSHADVNQVSHID